MLQGGSLWAGLASGAMSQFQDTKNLNQGNIDRTEYAVQTASNVTGAVGVMAGVEYGALLGTSVMPGIGTAVGAVIGGVLGDRLGRVVGRQTGSALVQSDIVKNIVQPASSKHTEAIG
ncbi:glycine zipper domain-containing protein [Paenibacillus hodogayensis]|uniref:Glycine zipper domain-containing protein n=1 Tax=Paenibacillus hodogayensis TaxID=279208 RepID=A0ABV5W3E7_9BACL